MKFSAIGVPFFPESSLELVEASPAERDYDRLVSRIQALEKWQMEHDLEKSSRFPRTEQTTEKRLDALEQHDIDSAIRISRLESGKANENPEPELKVGDWVKIDFPGHFQHGTIFRIIQIDSGDCMDTSGELFWDMRYLRKLSDEEIARWLNR